MHNISKFWHFLQLVNTFLFIFTHLKRFRSSPLYLSIKRPIQLLSILATTLTELGWGAWLTVPQHQGWGVYTADGTPITAENGKQRTLHVLFFSWGEQSVTNKSAYYFYIYFHRKTSASDI